MLKKVIIVLCVFCIILNLSTITTYATTITKEAFEDSIKGYTSGEKTASATSSNGRENTIGDYEEELDVSFTDNTISISGIDYEYDISQENNTILIYRTTEITSNDSFYSYTDKISENGFFSLLFVSVTDIYDIDSNQSLYYFKEYDKMFVGSIPSEVDEDNGVSYMKWFSTTEYFSDINNSVFNYSKTILENNDNEFKYTTNLKINLDKLSEIEGNNIEEPNPEEDKSNNDEEKANNNTNNSGTVINTNKNNNVTKSDSNLPKTGGSSIINMFLFLGIILTSIAYMKSKEYEDIK